MISVHPEMTFERLRYPFGGDRPSQTVHLTLSLASFQMLRLEISTLIRGIPPLTPYELASILLCLPPILYINIKISVLNYSKAPWGLSVLSRVASIFTGTSISPGALSRQCPNRFTFRAGQNLPDKEFRYLRTVIVTAAVYWGLSLKLRINPNLSP